MMQLNEEEDLEEIKIGDNESLTEFEKIVNKQIMDVSKFTALNLDTLIYLIFEDCQDLDELEKSIDIVRSRMVDSQERKAMLTYQTNMTKKEIIDENLLNIFLVYNATGVALLLTNPNPIEFIKKFLIIGLIGITSFDINARYFASEYRKKKIHANILKIDKYVEISKYDIQTLKQFRKMYIKELNYEVNKLFEIVDDTDKTDIQQNHDRIIELLRDLNLEAFIDDENIKSKIKKKKL